MSDMSLSQKRRYVRCPACAGTVLLNGYCSECGEYLQCYENLADADEEVYFDPDETIWICGCGNGNPMRARFCGCCGTARSSSRAWVEC